MSNFAARDLVDSLILSTSGSAPDKRLKIEVLEMPLSKVWSCRLLLKEGLKDDNNRKSFYIANPAENGLVHNCTLFWVGGNESILLGAVCLFEVTTDSTGLI